MIQKNWGNGKFYLSFFKVMNHLEWMRIYKHTIILMSDIMLVEAFVVGKIPEEIFV